MHGAYKGNIKVLFQQRARQVCAAAVAVNDVIIAVFYKLTSFFQSDIKAAFKNLRRYSHFARRFRKFSLHIADKIGVYVLVKAVQERKYMRFRTA